MTIVLLALLGNRWAFAYIFADLGLYLVVKVLRGDFWYVIRAGKSAEFIISLLCRIAVKLIADFTSLVQLRHPNEVGGFNWLLGFMLTMGSLPVAIKIAEPQGDETKALPIARAVLIASIPLTLSAFALFFYNIERKYFHTFFNMTTGVDFSVESFRHASSDLAKASIALGRSKKQWESIEEEVRNWVEVNWEIWEEENPKWLNERRRAKIPVEYIPTASGRNKEKVGRASVDTETEKGVGGALRVSIRRASVELGVGIDKARVVPTSEIAN